MLLDKLILAVFTCLSYNINTATTFRETLMMQFIPVETTLTDLEDLCEIFRRQRIQSHTTYLFFKRQEKYWRKKLQQQSALDPNSCLKA
jgi:hypothetical protein